MTGPGAASIIPPVSVCISSELLLTVRDCCTLNWDKSRVRGSTVSLNERVKLPPSMSRLNFSRTGWTLSIKNLVTRRGLSVVMEMT